MGKTLVQRDSNRKSIKKLVLQQYWFDGYRAIQSVQDKAQVEANVAGVLGYLINTI